MTKSETREIVKLATWHKVGAPADIIARSLAALIRAARTNKSRAALLEYAPIFAVAAHPDFVI
jgi:hypothetical protein